MKSLSVCMRSNVQVARQTSIVVSPILHGSRHYIPVQVEQLCCFFRVYYFLKCDCKINNGVQNIQFVLLKRAQFFLSESKKSENRFFERQVLLTVPVIYNSHENETEPYMVHVRSQQGHNFVAFIRLGILFLIGRQRDRLLRALFLVNLTDFF